MNSIRNYLHIAIVALSIGFSGCFGLGGFQEERSIVVDEGGQPVSFSIESKALLQQVLPNRNSRSLSNAGNSLASRSTSAVLYYSGDLVITQGNTLIGNYQVTGMIDDSDWNVEIFHTLVLNPGIYTFELLLTRTDQQYSGITTYNVIADQTNSVPMQIFPIIGDTVVNTETVSELGSFKFYYSDIPTLQNIDPILGVIVDGSDEQVFDISNDTGMTETYLNLSVGTHSIELKLYDGQQQIGKSIPAQEIKTIIAGQTFSMDIIPVYGEMVHSVSVAGNDASFDIRIPGEIVDLAGGTSNLSIPYIINGPGTGYNALEGEITSLTPDSTNDYLASINLSGSFLYSTAYIYLSFRKTLQNELIGTCNIQTSLNSKERTSLCSIPVTNSLISSGSLLSTVGITVCEADASGDCGTPIGGLVIHDVSNDSQIGITSDGTTSTTGFLQANLKAGDYTLRATHSDGRFGESTFTVESLQVSNIEIFLSASAPTLPNIIINGDSQFTYSHYVTLDLSAQDQNGITDYYISEDPTPPGDSGWTAVSQTKNFQASRAFQVSAGTGLKNIYAWFRNTSGHLSQRAQSSITVQDNTSLHFGNFRYTGLFNPSGGSADDFCKTNLSNTGYRVADWQEVLTVLTTDPSRDTSDFVNMDGGAAELAASSGTKTSIFGWESWNNPNPADGAFVTYNGNISSNGEHYAISIPSDNLRDIEFGWNPVASESRNDTAGSIQLYTIGTSAEVDPFASTRVLCYLDSGAHPLMNGDFSDGRSYWDHVAGSAEVINNALALHSYDTSGDYSRVEQSKIAVASNTNYTIGFQAKTSTEVLNLKVGLTGAQVLDASSDETPAIWSIDTVNDVVELAGSNDINSLDNYFFNIQMQILTDSTADIILYFEFANGGSNGQSATIDNVTLTKNP